MRYGFLILGVILLSPVSALADKPPQNDGMPPDLAKKGGGPPGLAKKGGLPPGLAKKFRPAPPQRAYIAFDPKRDDRAWFLIGDQWVLKQRFDPRLRVEVRRAMALPPAPPPPVPLSPLNIEFRVVLVE